MLHIIVVDIVVVVVFVFQLQFDPYTNSSTLAVMASIRACQKCSSQVTCLA